ncbi:MAG: PhoX family protein [Acidobacteria bacterium]|nr:PhoX family protein [Acidobacteriota bacterium]MCA1637047.1 PhoX family protein [Acidobacteriota bacterium]
MNRRLFLTSLSLASSGAFLAFGGLAKRAEALANAENLSHLKAFGYGELIPMATKNTGETFMTLPKGFEYNVFGKVGSKMSDGQKTPPAHDGMATFEVRNELRIVRNHEVSGRRVPKEGSAIGMTNHYDETAGGGTTTLIINPKTREIVRDFVSLSGTLINCAGGRTPWGSWISCEETTLGQTVVTNARGVKEGGFLKPHGYCFEVSASANNNLPPTPLKAMGRFVHEAIAIDKKSGTVYLTEDNGKAGFYRFLPKRNKRLAEGGVLQMLAVKDKPNFDTRTGQKMRANYTANWVTIDNPDPAEADVDDLAVFKQGFAKGGATFSRLEDCYPDKEGRIYFVSTSGGEVKGGQIWLYEPHNKNEGRLTLLFESPSREILDMPDNICLKPKSDLLFICEDSDYVGEGGTPDNFLRILTPDGKIADFARNITPNFSRSEFAGSTFSKDGKTLFVNLQIVGATFAIWGDWDRFKA